MVIKFKWEKESKYWFFSADRNAVAEELFNKMWDKELQPNWYFGVLVQFPAIEKFLIKLCQS